MASKIKMTIAQYLFNYLYEQGIDTAFGIPGDFVLPTFRHLQNSKIKIVNMTHEPSVGFAADGYARVNGLGLAVVTYCVGGLNMVNSIACAYAEKSPVIVVSGGPSPKERYYDPMLHHKVRDFDTQYKIFQEITCASTVLLSPERAVSEIIRVVNEVKKHSRPGYIELPFDMADMMIDIREENNLEHKIEYGSDKEVLDACVDEIVMRINKAKNPVIIAGIELHRYKMENFVTRFAEKYNLFVASTMMSKSIISENHPLYVGVYSSSTSNEYCRKYVEESDCIILIGAFISDDLMGYGYPKISRRDSIVISSEEIKVGLQSYDNIIFSDILNKLEKSKISKRAKTKNRYIENLLNKKQDKIKNQESIKVERMFSLIGSYLQENSTLVCDTGDSLLGALSIPISTKARFFADAYYLSMGFAIPASVGIIKALPKNKTFIIVGDGAFQMTGMELSTIAKYKLSPVVIIINNDGYGTQRHIIDGEFNNILMWDYTKICDVLRYGKAVQVTSEGQLDKALKEAVTYKELYLIEVKVRKDDCSSSLRAMGESLAKIRNIT